jgi:hypothetical protein
MKVTMLKDRDVIIKNKLQSLQENEKVEVDSGLAMAWIKSGIAEEANPAKLTIVKSSDTDTEKSYFRHYQGGGKHVVLYGNPSKKKGEPYKEKDEVVYFDDKEKAEAFAAEKNDNKKAE